MKSTIITALAQLKLAGHKEIYYIEAGGQDFLCRPLTFCEYNAVIDLEQVMSTPALNDDIIRLCTLYFSGDIEDWLDWAPGFIPDKVAQVIIDVSGFHSPDHFIRLVKQKRQEVDQLNIAIQQYICQVFHSFKPEDIENMTMEQQVSLLVRAEQIIGTPLNVDGISNDEERAPGHRLPVPPGFETTRPEDIMSRSDMPNFDAILAGKETY